MFRHSHTIALPNPTDRRPPSGGWVCHRTPSASAGVLQREDESNDAEFYTMPRLVVHIDDGAIVAVGRLFQQLIPENAEVLDLMSSWRTHWPEEHPRSRIIGLGMNAAEMADNPQLTEYLLKDINVDPLHSRYHLMRW